MSVTGLVVASSVVAGTSSVEPPPMVPAGPSIDFSSAGYGGGIEPPTVRTAVTLTPGGGDDTFAIQAALDRIGATQPGPDGFRGAVVLAGGEFRVAGQLFLRASGVVLRGEGARILATGSVRRALIVVEGARDRIPGPAVAVAADVAAGAVTLPVAALEGLRVGTRVLVHRPSTAAWLASIGMDALPGKFHEVRLDWTPGSRDLEWDRVVVALDAGARTITLDAPITTALETRWGGGSVEPARWPGRLSRVGVEDLTLVSAFDASNPADEEHAWFGVHLDAAEDAWVRRVTVRHFASSAVLVGREARAVTVSDCRSEAPVAERGGWRRMAFFTRGQLVLFRHCTSEEAWNPFATGQAAAGPTVFHDCSAARTLGPAGPAESWASGVLYDNVRIDGAALRLGRAPLAGWAVAQGLAWNCTAVRVEIDSPPGAENRRVTDSVVPSIYLAQCAARGAARATVPAADGTLPPRSQTAADEARATGAEPPALSIAGGHLRIGDRVLGARSARSAWWKGQMGPRAAEFGWSPTRWAPGRIGPGLTENLPALVTRLKASGVDLLEVVPGLWYDRRRDDHTTGARADGGVAAPFFESPWARGGSGVARDGLSRYDLSRFNPWYFGRLRELAGLCRREGLALVHYFYNHHNLVEAAAHWADFPWRPGNCIQETGFPEPPPEAGTVRLATAFYDTTNAVRRDLHRRFIRHGLEALAEEPNVIHALAFQDAAPLEFQRFFLDTVAEWQRETGRHARVALVTGKNVTDAILADPRREALVAVVDTRFWQVLPDGTLFAPPAGTDRAFREARTEAFGEDAVPRSTPERILGQIQEYAGRWPDKAVLCPQAEDAGFRY